MVGGVACVESASGSLSRRGMAMCFSSSGVGPAPGGDVACAAGETVGGMEGNDPVFSAPSRGFGVAEWVLRRERSEKKEGEECDASGVPPSTPSSFPCAIPTAFSIRDDRPPWEEMDKGDTESSHFFPFSSTSTFSAPSFSFSCRKEVGCGTSFLPFSPLPSLPASWNEAGREWCSRCGWCRGRSSPPSAWTSGSACRKSNGTTPQRCRSCGKMDSLWRAHRPCEAVKENVRGGRCIRYVTSAMARAFPSAAPPPSASDVDRQSDATSLAPASPLLAPVALSTAFRELPSPVSSPTRRVERFPDSTSMVESIRKEEKEEKVETGREEMVTTLHVPFPPPFPPPDRTDPERSVPLDVAEATGYVPPPLTLLFLLCFFFFFPPSPSFPLHAFLASTPRRLHRAFRDVPAS